MIRSGKLIEPTAGLAPNYVQANLVILPEAYAKEFYYFALLNSKSCPIIDVIKDGKTEFANSAPTSNIQTDISKYRIYEKGRLVVEVEDIKKYWREDYWSFLLGCSFTFEAELISSGIEMRHISQGRNVSMYKTNIPCVRYGRFSGNMVVSMRPISKEKVEDVIDITSKYPNVHGAPVNVGEPEKIGVDVNKVDFGDPVEIRSGEIPVFWACGVTPQQVIMESKPDVAITHSPGYMFITDLTNKSFEK